MAEQNDPEEGGYGSDEKPLSGLVKTYIDEQVKNAVKQQAEPSPKRKKWRNSWRAASPLTKASFMLAATVAVATISYTIAAWRTLGAMRDISADNSRQTAQLIDAANQIKSAAWQFKGSAQGIDGNLGNAVAKLQSQADNIEAARETSEKSSRSYLSAVIDNFRQEQRAWVGFTGFVVEPDPAYPAVGGAQGLSLAVADVFNSGKTPATQVTAIVGVSFQSDVYALGQVDGDWMRDTIEKIESGATAPKANGKEFALGNLKRIYTVHPPDMPASDEASVEEISLGVIPPNIPIRFTVPTNWAILGKPMVVVVYGRLRYVDSAKKSRFTSFCGYREHNLKEFKTCPIFNDMN